MKPAARVQSAIEIVASVLGQGLAADRALQAWGRANRFAGSGDRRAIGEHVYAALRSGEGRDARRAVLAGLRAAGTSADEIDLLFDGSRHAPGPLTAEERGATDGCADDWLRAALRPVFGEAVDEELAALSQRAPIDLRINTLKADRAAAEQALLDDGIATEPMPTAPLALRLRENRPDLAGLHAFETGLVEIQDAGSQLVSLLCDAQPGHSVLDLCAGAGGKSLAMAAAMRNQGRILATDIAAIRLDRLRPRLTRAGAEIVETQLLPEDWLETGRGPAGQFDRVVVDAPCSGSGTWRRNPETRLRLTPERVAELADLQGRILAAAAERVAPRGRLIYITCSILREEGEAVVERFLERHTAFTPINAAALYRDLTGLEPPPRFGQTARLTPATDGTDGFFAAILAHA